MLAVRISPLPSCGTLFLGSDRVHEGEEILPGMLETLIYLPDTDWFGSDSFGWAGSDGADYSQVTGLVSMTISPGNDNPQITDDLESPVVMDEDGSPRAFDLVLHAADVDLVDNFSWSIVEQPENGSASLNPAGFEVRVIYQPSRGYSGSDTLTVQVEDGNGGTDRLQIEVLVESVNNSPLVRGSNAGTEEEASLHFKPEDFLENYTDDADHDRMQAIRITAAPGHGGLLLDGTPVQPGSEIPVDALEKLDYLPELNFTGADTFAWAGCDGQSCSEIPATITVSVSNLNDPPEIQPGPEVTASMDEDGSPHPFELVLEAVDPDPEETLTWSLLAPPEFGTASIEGTGTKLKVSYAPQADYNGLDEFTVQVQDTAGQTDSILVKVQINPANDLPVVSTVLAAGSEDLPVNFSADGFSTKFSDVDGDTLSAIKISSLPAHGSLSLDGVVVKSGQELNMTSAASLVYQPSTDYSGMDYFQWTGSDGRGWASPGSLVSITLAPVEDTPTLLDAGPFRIELTSARLPTEHHLVLHADDHDGDPLTWILVSSPAYGNLLASGEGYDLFLDYVPNNDYQGTDTFTIHLTDGHTAPIVIEVPVSGQVANRAPSAADGVLNAVVGQDVTFQPEDFQFTDLDGDTLQSIQVISLPAAGVLYLDENGDGKIADDETVLAGQVITLEDFPYFKFKPVVPLSSDQVNTFSFLVNDGSLFSLTGNLMLIHISCPNPRVFLPLLVK